ncbi:hypothetical protein BU23DRAFT_466445 [Bimuria novae-zelandiae CBS 107.79]|uniref:Complex 1 LYR protein domain-containing protein n=1 Tax=Bimuria novae-zelandiae CBS 107.79 TaxID=1447943 RepID=A0A6A5VHR6_9PLEO|nr:hypothetical protein BU23DRAFT_466445 [Bimuria novae-zelandiae CBS 107.79]
MPVYLPPKTHTKHRVAAIALYRALLSRCTSASFLQDEERTSLHNAIRNKFRQNRKIQSPRQLGLVFRAGYEVLDHLDASASSDPKSISFLKTLIPTLPRGITRAPPQRRPQPPPQDTSTKHPLAVLPPEKAVLNVRPYAKTSGPRHVPILASANGVPFLRLKKPQPESLSRVIRQKLDRRIKSFADKIMYANYWVPLARYEDEWDRILAERFGIVEARNGYVWAQEDKWLHEIKVAEMAAQEDFERLNATDRWITKRMVELIDKETELAMQEGQKIVRGRKGRPIRDLSLKQSTPS